MIYPKIENFLNSTTNESSKFGWVEVNHDSHASYSINSQIKFQGIMLKSALCSLVMHTLFVKEIQQLLA